MKILFNIKGNPSSEKLIKLTTGFEKTKIIDKEYEKLLLKKSPEENLIRKM